ncbi:MAG: Unknown protein [uncultured Thiotrichaceae bacterium]|uniref:Uncharacterized protein n=1 Tax=uncultured Thiotrichaceae bacterium TaxID=298394 RepID=A0A6S6TAQ8_9GAMM|nr:MAG: Unknown protein [uncultured Thiotrichaceae bacterium]
MLVFYRVLLVGFFSGILYVVHASFMANVIAASAQYADDKEAVYQNVLTWQPDHKEALSQLSVISLQKKSYENAVSFARQAIQVDPTNGRAMSVLITAYDALGELRQAEKALHLATKLWPSHAYVRVQSSEFWAKRGDMEKTLAEWDILLARHSAFYKDLFPILKVFVETEEYQHLLRPYFEGPALWWDRFFIYLTRQDTPIGIITEFYQNRLSEGSVVSLEERNAYVNRLIKEKQWSHAFSAWMGGLEKQERQSVSLVTDGDFEALLKPSAFSWSYRSRLNVKTKVVRVRGGQGKYAFKVTFNKRKPVTSSVLSQRLLLEPERSYTVTFKSKMEGLKNDQGIKWIVKCADQTHQVLSESIAVKGRSKWSESSFDVQIPEAGCSSQKLELVAASRFHHERFFQGSASFDDIKIEPMTLGQGKDSADDKS